MGNSLRRKQSQNTDYFDRNEDLSIYSGTSDYIDPSTTVTNPKDPGVPIKQCFLRCLGQKNVDQIVACEYAPHAVDFRHQG